jgi:CTP:molybdopterin cytidylyltransferase MocA
LLALSGDKGAKSLITQNVSDVDHVPAPEAAIDIDSLGDLEKLTEFELGIC